MSGGRGAVRALLVANLVLGTGYGVSLALTPLFLDALGLSAATVGGLASLFGAGLLAAALPAGAAVRRFGARPVLVAGTLLYAALILLFPFLSSPWALAGVRLGDGVSSVLVWVASEVLLLAQAGERRAHLLGQHALAGALGLLLGPDLARLLSPPLSFPGLYALASGLAVLCAGVVLAASSLRSAAPPGAPAWALPAAAPASASVSLMALALRLRAPCLSGFVWGLFHASVVLLVPLFLLRERGLSPGTLVLLPALFVGGMLVGTPPLSRHADRTGYLAALRRLALAGAVLLALFPLLPGGLLPALAILAAGALLAAVHPIGLALQAVLAGPALTGLSNALYSGAYAAGRLVGPLLGGAALQAGGGGALMATLSCAWLLLALAARAWARDEAPRPLASPA